MVKTDDALLTLEQFIQRYGDDGPFEIIEGEIVPVTPQVTRSARIGFRFARVLADHVDKHGLGEVIPETPFVLMLESDWVKGSRVPDVMFIAADRLAQLAEDDPEWELKPIPFAPDVVAEVVSPTDRYEDVRQKIQRYLQDGVQVVWLIEPDARMVSIHAQGSSQALSLAADDTLDGGEIIPGFALQVGALFA